MSFRKTFKTIALTLVLTSSTLPMAAQDLIAKMAPVDRKVKALDTLALNTIKERENMESPSADHFEPCHHFTVWTEMGTSAQRS